MEGGQVEGVIMKWIEKAQVDYCDMYIRLYIAYNAWFRKVTRTSFDREALLRLKKRFIIWDDYVNDRVMRELRPILRDVAILTDIRPLLSGNKWNGKVRDDNDWHGLIDFWYQVRCELFHGTTDVPRHVLNQYASLAYQSLNIFMLEIMKRMKQSFTLNDQRRMDELDILIASSSGHTNNYEHERQRLHERYIHSNDVWTLDMVRV